MSRERGGLREEAAGGIDGGIQTVSRQYLDSISAEEFFLPYKKNRVNIEKMCIKYGKRLCLNV